MGDWTVLPDYVSLNLSEDDAGDIIALMTAKGTGVEAVRRGTQPGFNSYYVDALFRVWGERVEPQADLCCYWFEKARAMVEASVP